MLLQTGTRPGTSVCACAPSSESQRNDRQSLLEESDAHVTHPAKSFAFTEQEWLDEICCSVYINYFFWRGGGGILIE